MSHKFDGSKRREYTPKSGGGTPRGGTLYNRSLTPPGKTTTGGTADLNTDHTTQYGEGWQVSSDGPSQEGLHYTDQSKARSDPARHRDMRNDKP